MMMLNDVECMYTANCITSSYVILVFSCFGELQLEAQTNQPQSSNDTSLENR